MATQRNGILTGLEGSPMALATNLGKLRMFTTGPATEGVQAIVPGEPGISEVFNRSIKRLVHNDFAQFFSQCRTFRVEKNGDNNSAFFAYDDPTSSQSIPTIVSYLKPFASITDANNTVGALSTLIELANYLPNSINLWGVSSAGNDLDANMGTNAATTSFCIQVGASSKDAPFSEGVISDAGVDETSSQFAAGARPRITIAGQGTQSTFISNLSVNLTKNTFLELRDMTITTAMPLILTAGRIHFSNVTILGGIPLQYEPYLTGASGTVVFDNNGVYDTLALNGVTATKLSGTNSARGFGFYYWDVSKSKFYESACLGESTALQDGAGILK